LGHILEADIKVVQKYKWFYFHEFHQNLQACTVNEKQVIDTLIDEGAKLCGQLDRTIIQSR
jgi:hypothetical protein